MRLSESGRRRMFRSGALAAAVGCVCACSKAPRASEPGEVITVSRSDVHSEVVVPGAVKPQVGAEVRVGPRISGVLSRLMVRVGDVVEKGQLLAILAHADLDTAVRQARAVEKASRVRWDLERKTVSRRRALASEGLIAAEELDLKSQEEALAEAELERARAALEAAEIARQYAEIRAPISGTVTSIATREGETVASSFSVPTFVTIVDLERLQIEAYVGELDISRVRVGQTGTISVDAYPQTSFEGKVLALVPQAAIRENLVSYTVIVGIDTANEGLLRPDMTASVALATGVERGALVIPARAVQRDDQGHPFVVVRGAEGDARRVVGLGEVGGDTVRIRSGLMEGEHIVLPSGRGAEASE